MECPTNCLFFAWQEFWLGCFIGCILFGAFRSAMNYWDGWPTRKQCNKILYFFSTYQRLRRKGDRLDKRIWNMGQMKDRRTEIKNARRRIAELEQQLGMEAIEKPQEFLDTE